MTFLSERCRLGRLMQAPLAGLVALGASAALLLGCGGGTSQVEAFKPDRLLVFGDETSVIVDKDNNADGYRYTINDRTAEVSATVARCQSLPTFAQSLASTYGFVFKECNPGGAEPKAFTQARVNATVEDPVLGLAQQRAAVAGGLGSKDMALVMIGMNDMIMLWQRVRDGSLTDAAAKAEAQRLGAAAAGQVNAMLAAGARAIVVTIPDMGLSPYAVAQELVKPGAVALLSTMSYEFNAYLRTRIDSTAFDGRNYGLVLADDIVSAMDKLPATFLNSPAAVKIAACTPASAVDCLTTTLVDGASSTSHLWADDRHLGPSAHGQIASSAQSRALNNPF